MKANKLFKALLILTAYLCCNLYASAFSTTKYATNSRLATGKWVKIKIEKTGVYELTADELAQMGFNDISKVRIYGQGGYPISEILSVSLPDDLNAVPVAIHNNKVCFFGKGPVQVLLSSSTPHRFSRLINTYSTAGYYFITEDDNAPCHLKTAKSASIAGTVKRNTSIGCYYYEEDLISISKSGKEFFSDNIKEKKTYPVTLPEIISEQPVIINCQVGARVTSMTPLFGKLGTDTINFVNQIQAKTTFDYYTPLNTYGTIYPQEISPATSLTLGVENENNVEYNYLDFFTITYQQNNYAADKQVRLTFTDLTKTDYISITNNSDSLVIWDIENEDIPTNVKYTDDVELEEILGTTVSVPTKTFSPGKTGAGSYIVFDPSKTLYKISSYENIDNQNIHGVPTPDYVIVCPKNLHAQAERLAQLHRDIDGMDVFVVDQDKIFNEFSSGTPDASAIRLMLKMFYDRNPQKLKYLLMFGGGYFDNRQITRTKGDNYLLTYQSNNSNNAIRTFVSDDFFGFLTDNSGSAIESEPLSIGIGRLPAISTIEADNIVDKIEAYIKSSDFSNWRNKILIMEDKGDDYIHLYQGIKLEELLQQTDGAALDIKKLHIQAYILSDNGQGLMTFTKGNNNKNACTLQLSNYFQEGMLYVSYMGHGSYSSLSKALVWKFANFQETPIARLPIMTLAACDVANYDSDTRGIGEYMIITPGHGAAAILTSTRTVEATENDRLNRAFTKELFTFNSDGSPHRLGDAYRLAKLEFGNTLSRNKMCYTLFADPALQPAIPRSLAKITSINGADSTTTCTLKPMTNARIEGEITTATGEIDTNFNGNATISLYDEPSLYTNFTFNGASISAYNSRPLLTETNATVVNGKFSASFLIPKDCKAGANGLIRVYAHNEDNSKLVNGVSSNISFAEYNTDDSETIIDTDAPVIEKMYINDEAAFINDINVPQNFTVHIYASDNLAMSNQSNNIGKQISLVMDGNTFFEQAKAYAAPSNDGKSQSISLPLTGIAEGQHTLKVTVFDAAGNSSSQTITFVVVTANPNAELSIDEELLSTKATFNLSHTFASNPEVKICVTNATNEIVWSKTVQSFPYEWNLTDNNGAKLAPGIYNYFGTAITPSQNCGTKIKQAIVIEPEK